MSELEKAWTLRESLGIFATSQAVRVFHGPGEGSGLFRQVSIDLFGPATSGHFWVSYWEEKGKAPGKPVDQEILGFLRRKDARSVVLIQRPEKGLPPEPVSLLGSVPTGRFPITENGMTFQIQLLGSRHPGLFLDHAPLRLYLKKNARDMKVLNTFAYTGSLSVACGMGGASHVTTLDLSAPTMQWAQENWKANSLPDEKARFITGDYFEWVPKFARQNEKFDCIILDPPSFSRGKKGSFSTSKDLRKLHELALAVLKPGGVCVTAINSANVPREKLELEILAASKSSRRDWIVLSEIQLPETFPTRLDAPMDRYLKGWVLKAR